MDGVLVTDMIVEEAGEYLRICSAIILRRFFLPRLPAPMSA